MERGALPDHPPSLWRISVGWGWRLGAMVGFVSCVCFVRTWEFKWSLHFFSSVWFFCHFQFRYYIRKELKQARANTNNSNELLAVREKSSKSKDSSVNRSTVIFNNSLVKIIIINECWSLYVDIQHLLVFIRQKGSLGVRRVVGRIVKAREHLPPSHYHVVSSCETEGIWAQREGSQDLLLHPPSLARDDAS